MELGSWTGLLTGIGSIVVAAVLGAMAVREAKSANHWAEQAVFWSRRATEATERATEIALASLPVRFTAEYGLEWFDGPQMQDHLTVTNDGSTVWVHSVEARWGVFKGLSDNISLIMGPREIEVVDPDVMPVQLHRAEWIVCDWPGSTVNLNDTTHWLLLAVKYSIALDGELRSVQAEVEFPSPDSGPWPGVAT